MDLLFCTHCTIFWVHRLSVTKNDATKNDWTQSPFLFATFKEYFIEVTFSISLVGYILWKPFFVLKESLLVKYFLYHKCNNSFIKYVYNKCVKEVWYNCSVHHSAHIFNIEISSCSHLKKKQPRGIFLQYSYYLLISLSRTLTFQKRLCYLLQWKPFKNDEKCYLFHLKISFPSQDI